MLLNIAAITIMLAVIGYFVCYFFWESFGFKNKDQVSFIFGLIFFLAIILLYFS